MMPVDGGGGGGGQLSVPPGFRFHPTDEELLYYYLRKKVCYEAIDLDVIREVDLNKLEPWDLKEKCRIGSGPQNEWYLFSHKDKKYPTGSRTNRATTAGFWKATGRDKAIHHLNTSKRIGMRKTLVFYIGRAPHGQKTDWIMHEYRLLDHLHHHQNPDIQEDGWVVCRVFKKKCTNSTNHRNFFQPDENFTQTAATTMADDTNTTSTTLIMEPNKAQINNYTLDNSMHLPQLLSHDALVVLQGHSSCNTFVPVPNNYLTTTSSTAAGVDQCLSHNLVKSSAGGLMISSNQPEKFSSDWSFLDKLLASSQSLDQGGAKCYHQNPLAAQVGEEEEEVVHYSSSSAPPSRFPFQYLGTHPPDHHFLNFPK